MVFDDPLAEANFLSVARREMDRSGAKLPSWVSHRETLERTGTFGKAWRNPDVMEPTRMFV